MNFRLAALRRLPLAALFVFTLAASACTRIGHFTPVDPPFDMPAFTPPSFPDRTFNITEFGARAGGTTLNTSAFDAAIKACNAAGGGQVVVPAGRWLTGPIHLRSNVNLHLAEGAEVRFSTNYDDYLPMMLVRYEGTECYNYSPLINIRDCENVAITGTGTLDGQGEAWWQRFGSQGNARLLEMNANQTPLDRRRFGTVEDGLRPNFLVPWNAKNVLLEGFTITNGPMWTIHPVYSENVIIRDITFLTEGPNGDGIDPDSCDGMLIENCRFQTADDAIAIKSGKDADGWRVGRPCENIVIRHCTFGLGQETDGVVSIGSEMSGDVRNVLIHDSTFNNTERGIRIKSRRGRGAVVENCLFQNITVGSVALEAIFINTYYPHGAPSATDTPPVFRNVTVRNLTCEEAEVPIRVIGLPEQPITDIHFENISVARSTNTEPTAVRVIDSQNVTFDRIEVRAPVQYVFDLTDTRKVTADGVYLRATADELIHTTGDFNTGTSIEGPKSSLKMVKSDGN